MALTLARSRLLRCSWKAAGLFNAACMEVKKTKQRERDETRLADTHIERSLQIHGNVREQPEEPGLKGEVAYRTRSEMLLL